MHTPSGETAFNNIDKFKPKKKMERLQKGLRILTKDNHGINQHIQ